MANVGRIAMYIIVGLVIVAALTHPAGAASGMTAAGNVLTGESAILSGQNQIGGTSSQFSLSPGQYKG